MTISKDIYYIVFKKQFFNSIMSIDISVILPCYNSASSIQKTLVELSYFIQQLNRTFEIIISDDGSNDKINEIDWHNFSCKYNCIYIFNNQNKGKGEAIRQGLKTCQGKFIFLMDIDIPVDLKSFEIAFKILEKNEFDVVIGDRKNPDSIAIGSAPLNRFIASKIFNIGVRILILPGYKDTQCPLKGFNHNVIKSILPMTLLNSFSFDAEIIYLAKISGYKIKKIPVIWNDVRSPMKFSKLLCLVITCLIDVFRVRLASEIRQRRINF